MSEVLAKPGKDLFGKDLNGRVMVPGSLIGVYPHGYKDAPADKTPTPEEALKSTRDDFGIDVRCGVLESDEKFPGPVNSWHCHHYFDNKDPDQIKFAMELRWKALQMFPMISVNKILKYAPELGGKKSDVPVGQFELELHTPHQFAAYLPWVTANHGNLNIMLHPNKGMDADPGHQSMFSDHTTDNFWMGKRELIPGFAKRLEGFFTTFRKEEDRPTEADYGFKPLSIGALGTAPPKPKL